MSNLSKTEVKEIAEMAGCNFDILSKEDQNFLYTAINNKDLFSKISEIYNKNAKQHAKIFYDSFGKAIKNLVK